jgi:hypothetical protein
LIRMQLSHRVLQRLHTLVGRQKQKLLRNVGIGAGTFTRTT